MNRSALAVAAVACYASAIFLWPDGDASADAGVRSQLGVAPPEHAAAAPRTQPSLVAIAPQGDAFAPRAAVDDDPPPVRLPAPLPPLRALRPNAALVRPATPVRVTAIATGADPTAIVETGGSARIVTVGDPLDGSSIAAIDDDAIRLADGRSLPLEPPEGAR